MSLFLESLFVAVLSGSVGYVARDILFRSIDRVLHRKSHAVQMEILQTLREIRDQKKGYYEL